MKRMGVTGGLVVAMILVCGSATRAGAQSDSGAEVTKAQYDTWMTELSNWGRWGADDELGALNLITPAKRLEAASLVTRGTVVSMAREMTIERLDDPDQASANRPPVLVGSSRSVFDINTEGGYFWERYEIEYHGSAVSHLDALCHVAYNGKVYNGLDFEDVASKEDGCTRMGVANLREGLITRGVLIDMPGRAVRREDIEAWEAETGITISSGDALFLRTGRDIGERGGYHPSLIPFFNRGIHLTAPVGRIAVCLGPECTTRGTTPRCVHGFPTMPRVGTTWTGCAGLRVSDARPVTVRRAGSWAAESAVVRTAVGGYPAQPAPSSRTLARRSPCGSPPPGH